MVWAGPGSGASVLGPAGCLGSRAGRMSVLLPRRFRSSGLTALRSGPPCHRGTGLAAVLGAGPGAWEGQMSNALTPVLGSVAVVEMPWPARIAVTSADPGRGGLAGRLVRLRRGGWGGGGRVGGCGGGGGGGWGGGLGRWGLGGGLRGRRRHGVGRSET